MIASAVLIVLFMNKKCLAATHESEMINSNFKLYISEVNAKSFNITKNAHEAEI